jgi:hypothetical protein
VTTLREGELELRLPTGTSGRVFDEESTHELSHCMKAVDFIVELRDRILFIEFKDPEDRAARAHPNATGFIREFQSGQIDRALAVKYRDSFLYEWAADRLRKPVHYLVVVAIAALDPALLVTRTDALKRELPLDGPSSGAWQRRLVEHCLVLNIDKWNEHIPSMPLHRAGT